MSAVDMDPPSWVHRGPTHTQIWHLRGLAPTGVGSTGSTSSRRAFWWCERSPRLACSLLPWALTTPCGPRPRWCPYPSVPTGGAQRGRRASVPRAPDPSPSAGLTTPLPSPKLSGASRRPWPRAVCASEGPRPQRSQPGARLSCPHPQPCEAPAALSGAEQMKGCWGREANGPRSPLAGRAGIGLLRGVGGSNCC